MNGFLISSSILLADFARLGENSSKIVSAGVDMIHFDVMDNHYVPNLSMGPMILKSLRSYGISVPIDVHLMIKPVDSLIPDFVSAGANYIIFHPEATEHVDRSLQLIRGFGCKSGLALNPTTTLDFLEYVIDKIDIILVMSVNPGFGGQLFLPLILEKLRKIRLLIDRYSTTKIILSVDGGITLENIASVATAGADMFVVGSSIFCASDYKKVVDDMRNVLSLVVRDD